MELGVAPSSQQASSGQFGASTHPFDPRKMAGARLALRGWEDGPDVVCGGMVADVQRRSTRGRAAAAQRGANFPV